MAPLQGAPPTGAPRGLSFQRVDDPNRGVREAVRSERCTQLFGLAKARQGRGEFVAKKTERPGTKVRLSFAWGGAQFLGSHFGSTGAGTLDDPCGDRV